MNVASTTIDMAMLKYDTIMFYLAHLCSIWNITLIWVPVRYPLSNMAKKNAWENFSSAARPPYPQDGDEHKFTSNCSIKESEKEGQYTVEHSAGFVLLWESQMQPIADEFADGKTIVQVKWTRKDRRTHALIMGSK